MPSVMKEDDPNVLSDKEKRNEEYLAKLDRSFAQLEAGLGKYHELIETEYTDTET